MTNYEQEIIKMLKNQQKIMEELRLGFTALVRSLVDLDEQLNDPAEDEESELEAPMKLPEPKFEAS